MRRAHHGGVVAERGGVLGQPQGFDGRLDAGAGDHHLVGRRRFHGRLQHVAPLLIAEQDGLAGRALHHHARDRRPRVPVDIGFELSVVNIAVGIERRGDGRKDSVQEHDQVAGGELPISSEIAHQEYSVGHASCHRRPPHRPVMQTRACTAARRDYRVTNSCATSSRIDSSALAFFRNTSLKW